MARKLTSVDRGTPTKEFQVQSLKATSEELRNIIAQLKNDLERERTSNRKLKREQKLEVKKSREEEQQKAAVALSDIKSKLHQEKQAELALLKETLAKQQEAEVRKLTNKQKKESAKGQKELEGQAQKIRSEVSAEIREEMRKQHDAEKIKILQEIQELKTVKRKAEENVTLSKEAEKKQAYEIKRVHEEYQTEIEQIRKDARRDIIRLIEEVKLKEKVILDLEKELGHQSGYSQRLQLEKDSLADNLLNLTKMADSWDRNSNTKLSNINFKLEPHLQQEMPEDKKNELSEMKSGLKKLKEQNMQLVEERNSLHKKLQAVDSKNGLLLDKNRQLRKKAEEIEGDKKRLEQKVQVLYQENSKLKSVKSYGTHKNGRRTPTPTLPGRRTPTPTLQDRRTPTPTLQENAEENEELAKLKEQLQNQFKTIIELKQMVMEKDRKLLAAREKLRKKTNMFSSAGNSRSATPCSMDNSTSVFLSSSSVTSLLSNSTATEEHLAEADQGDVEDKYHQLTQEYFQLQNAHADLQSALAKNIDTERERQLRIRFQEELLNSQERIRELEKGLKKWENITDLTEESNNLTDYESLKIKFEAKEQKMQADLQEARDQVELLEFRILELENPGSPTRKKTSLAFKSDSSCRVEDISVFEIRKKINDILTSEDSKMSAKEKDDVLSIVTAVLDNTFKNSLQNPAVKEEFLDVQEQTKLNKQLANQVNDLQKNLEAKIEDLKNMDVLILDLEIKTKEAENFKKELNGARQQINLLEAKFRDTESYQEDKLLLQKEIEDLRRKLGNPDQGTKHEEVTLQKKLKEIKEAQEKITELERMNADLGQDSIKLHSVQIQLKEIEKEMAENKLHLETMEKSKREVSSQFEITKKDLQESQIENDKLEKKLKELQNHLTVKLNDIARLESIIKDQNVQPNSAKGKSVIQDRIEELESQVIELQENIHHNKAEFNQQLEEKDNEYKILKNSLKKYKQSKTKLEQQLESSQIDLDFALEEKDKMKKNIKKLEKSEITWKKQLKEVENEIGELQEKLEEKDQEIIHLKSSRKMNVEENFQKELSKLKNNEHHLEEKVKNLAQTKSELKENEEKLEEELQKLKNASEILEKDYENLLLKIENLEQNNTTLRKDLETSWKEKQNILFKFNELKNENDGAQKNNKELITSITKERDELKDRYISSLNKIENLQTENQALGKNNQDSEEKIEELKSQAEHLTIKISDFQLMESQLKKEQETKNNETFEHFEKNLKYKVENNQEKGILSGTENKENATQSELEDLEHVWRKQMKSFSETNEEEFITGLTATVFGSGIKSTSTQVEDKLNEEMHSSKYIEKLESTKMVLYEQIKGLEQAELGLRSKISTLTDENAQVKFECANIKADLQSKIEELEEKIDELVQSLDVQEKSEKEWVIMEKELKLRIQEFKSGKELLQRELAEARLSEKELEKKLNSELEKKSKRMKESKSTLTEPEHKDTENKLNLEIIQQLERNVEDIKVVENVYKEKIEQLEFALEILQEDNEKLLKAEEKLNKKWTVQVENVKDQKQREISFLQKEIEKIETTSQQRKETIEQVTLQRISEKHQWESIFQVLEKREREQKEELAHLKSKTSQDKEYEQQVLNLELVNTKLQHKVNALEAEMNKQIGILSAKKVDMNSSVLKEKGTQTKLEFQDDFGPGESTFMLKRQIRKLEENENSYREKFLKAEITFKKEIEEMERDHSQKVQQLENSLHETRNLITEMKENAVNFKQTAKENVQLQIQIGKLEDMKKELEQEVLAIDKREIGLKKNNEELQNRVNNLTVKEKNLNGKILNLEISLRKLDDDINFIKIEHSKKEQLLQSELSQVKISDTNLKKTLEELQNRELALNKQLSSGEESHRRSENSLKQTQKVLENKLNSLEVEKNKMNKLVKELELSENMLKKKVKQLENSESSLKQRIFEQEANESVLKRKIRDLETTESIKKMDLSQMKTDKEIAENRLTGLKNSKQELQKKVEELTHNEIYLKEQVKDLEKEIVKLKKKMQELETTISLLETKIIRAKETEKEFNKVQDELQASKEQIVLLEQSKMLLKDQLRESESLSMSDENLDGNVVIAMSKLNELKAQVSLLALIEKDQEVLEKSEAALKLKVAKMEQERNLTEPTKIIDDLKLDLKKKTEVSEKSGETFPKANFKTSDAATQTLTLKAVDQEFLTLQEAVSKDDHNEKTLKQYINNYPIGVLPSSPSPTDLPLRVTDRMTKEEIRNNLIQYLPQDQSAATLTQIDAQDDSIGSPKVKETLIYKDSIDLADREAQQPTPPNPSERKKLISDFVSALPMKETSSQEQLSDSVYLGQVVEEPEVIAATIEPPPPLPLTPAPSIQFAPSESDISEMSEYFENTSGKAHGGSPPRLLVWTRPLEDEDVYETEREASRRSYIYQPPSLQASTASPLTTSRRRRTNVPPPTATKPPTPLWIKKLVERQQKMDSENWEELEKLRTELHSLKEGNDETDATNSKSAKERTLELESTEQELRNMRSEIATINFEIGVKDSQLTNLQAEIVDLNKQLRATDKDKEIISKLKDELDKSLIQIEKKNHEINSRDSQGTLYKLQLDKREKEISFKENELERKATELTALREEIDSVETEKSEAMTDADSKYFELLAQYELLKRQLQDKLEENERLLRELIEAQDTIASLRQQIAELERMHGDRDVLQSKLKATEAALKRKAGEEKRLYQELALVQHKLESQSDLNRTRDSLERNYKDIKRKYDVMEHRRKEAELAVVPLKAKVSRLIKKCKERDQLIDGLVRELKLLCPGDSSSQLLKQAAQLQAQMATEEHNQAVVPSCYSPFRPESPNDRTLQEMSHHALLEESRQELSTSGRLLSPERVHELSEPLWQAVERATPSLLTNGSSASIDNVLRRASGSSPLLNNNALQNELKASQQKDALIDSLLEGRRDSQRSSSSRGLSPSTTPASVMGNTSSEEILHMHEELQDLHINNYMVGHSLSSGNQPPQMGEVQLVNGLQQQQQQQQQPLYTGNNYAPSSGSSPQLGNNNHFLLPSSAAPLLGPTGLGGQDQHDSSASSHQSLTFSHPSRRPKPEGCPDPVSSFVILRVIGSHSVLLNWSPPPMDQMGRNQGLQVTGYKIHANGKLKQHVASAHLTKALVDGLNLSRPVSFSIQTVSVTGQTSHPVSVDLADTVPSTSSARSESLTGESATESEFSSSLPSEYQEMPRTHKRTFMAVYDYDPTKHSPNDYLAYELAFKEGEIITVYGDARPDGFFFGKIGKRKGLVPSNFIEEVLSNISAERKIQSSKVENRKEKRRSSQNSASDYRNSPSECNSSVPFKNSKKKLSSSRI